MKKRKQLQPSSESEEVFYEQLDANMHWERSVLDGFEIEACTVPDLHAVMKLPVAGCGNAAKKRKAHVHLQHQEKTLLKKAGHSAKQTQWPPSVVSLNLTQMPTKEQFREDPKKGGKAGCIKKADNSHARNTANKGGARLDSGRPFKANLIAKTAAMHATKQIKVAQKAAQTVMERMLEGVEQLLMLRPVQNSDLIRSRRTISGFQGVTPHSFGFKASCSRMTCCDGTVPKYLGTFIAPEEAAQAYLQHYEKEHLEELEKERAPPLKVQQHLLIRSDKAKSGYKGVFAHHGR
jgi:hypothetical protein